MRSVDSGIANFSVRSASPADAGGILDCLETAFEPYRQSYTPEGFRDTVLTKETLRRRFAEMSLFVAASGDGEIVGTIGCAVVGGGEGHIRGMAVRTGWQGRGVAGRLLDAVEGDLRDRQCTRVTLDTTEPLERAARFYEKNGYRRSGKVGDFFGMPLFEYVKSLEKKDAASQGAQA